MNTISHGKQREVQPDEVVQNKPATPALDLLKSEIHDGAAALANKPDADTRARFDMVSRTDLRLEAVVEHVRNDPARTTSLELDKDTATKWVGLDVAEYNRLRSPERKELSLAIMAENARQVPEYAARLQERSPQLGEAAGRINEVVNREEAQRDAQRQAMDRQAQEDVRALAKQAALDAEAMARVNSTRKTQYDAVSKALGLDPQEPVRGGVLNREQQPTRPALDERTSRELGLNPQEPIRAGQANLEQPTRPAAGDQAPQSRDAADAGDEAAGRARASRRPVQEEDLPDHIKGRFVVGHNKQSLMDRGQTEFIYRSGDREGQQAFVDTGRQLSTAGEDRELIRNMVDVAKAKNWQEITVSGTDEFKRQVWLEAKLRDMDVNGYKPQEADLKRLAEIREAQQARTNSVSLAQSEQTRDGRQASQSRPQEDPEQLRARMVQTVRAMSPMTEKEEKAWQATYTAGNFDRAAQMREAANDRHRNDVSMVRVMTAPELRELANALQTPGKPDSEEKMRRVFDVVAQRRDPTAERVPEADAQRHNRDQAPSQGKGVHIDGDSLSKREQSTLEAARAVLVQNRFAPEFVKAVSEELESRMRAQRVHVGELVQHGAAPYQNRPDAAQSYFVTLRTAGGEETVWGKNIGKAITDGALQIGDQIVLSNTGKKPVDVTERVTGAQGQTETRWKSAELNIWTAQALDRLPVRAQESAMAAVGRQPTLQVYDLNAQRTAQQPQMPEPNRDHMPQDRGVDR